MNNVMDREIIESHLAKGEELRPDQLAELATLSDAFLYQFTPIAKSPAPPEVVFIPRAKMKRICAPLPSPGKVAGRGRRGQGLWKCSAELDQGLWNLHTVVNSDEVYIIDSTLSAEQFFLFRCSPAGIRWAARADRQR
jgi:hypothetical protein